MLTGCASSSGFADAPRIELAALPASVYAEASRRTDITPARLKACARKVDAGRTIEACELTKGEAKRLVTALVRSEARKVDALKAAIRTHGREKARLRKRGGKSAVKATKRRTMYASHRRGAA